MQIDQVTFALLEGATAWLSQPEQNRLDTGLAFLACWVSHSGWLHQKY